MSITGLSPRVRGNQCHAQRDGVRVWSIPACAGEPLTPGPVLVPGPVYPRVCGGTITISTKNQSVPGLSPRVRGNPRRPEKQQVRERSIPACAGEPRAAVLAVRRRAVYPRVCGGTSFGRISPIPAMGLSPRVRGNPDHRCWLTVPERSIPACAGEPSRFCGSSIGVAVYPRVCGGTPRRPPKNVAVEGLSPRVRGNQAGRRHHVCRSRSIPACAGEPG